MDQDDVKYFERINEDFQLRKAMRASSNAIVPYLGAAGNLGKEVEKYLSKKEIKITPPDWILTAEEEAQARFNFIAEQKKLYAWKLADRKCLEEKIREKIDEIDWEKIDATEYLDIVNRNKHISIQREKQLEENRQKEIEERKQLVARCNANYMYNGIQRTSFIRYNKKLIVNEDNRHLITAVCMFLSEDKRFEDELGYSFQKGLWIRGNVGLGKTHIIKCASANELNPILVTSILDITEQVREHGDFEFATSRIVYIDDVGTEQPLVKHYGTDITFFKSFIEKRYAHQDVYNNIIVSTNLSFDEVERMYGFRVRSRIKDMFNIINVTGKDMRGN